MKPSAVFYPLSPTACFIISFAGLYTSFLYYGLFQEKLYRTDYGATGNKFKFSGTVVFLQAVFSWVVALLINRYYYKIEKSSLPKKLQIEISLYYTLSVFASNQALRFIPFVVQALMKSSKLLSVMTISSFTGTEKFNRLQYFSAVLMTIGIIIFNLMENGKKASGSAQPVTLLGLGLLVLALFGDCMTNIKQGEARNKYKPSMFEMMESSNNYASLIALVYGLCTFEFSAAIQYIWNHPSCLTELTVIVVMGTVIQLFIYFTLLNFSSFILCVIISSVKFFTVLSSIIVFGHNISLLQWIAILLVFTGVSVEVCVKNHSHKLPHTKFDLDEREPFKTA